MKIRRCAVLYLEPREELAIDWASLFAGGSTLAASLRWMALAPHLDREIAIELADVAALGAYGQTVWTERAEAEQRHGGAVIARLLELGLLLGDAPEYAAQRERDETLRSQHWRPMSALAHTYGRWNDVRIDTGAQFPNFQELLNNYGVPPAPLVDLGAVEAEIKLPAPAGGALDDTLLQRYTGRNFDRQATLPLALAARLLQRSFGAQQQRLVSDDATVLKKTSPSAGGLHPIEAYVLAQRIDGVAPGLYHYHPLAHALRPLRAMARDEAAALALQMVADQHWFADAPMQVLLVARVARNFWKYRNHPKAYKAITLDAGHLSQTFYLLATEAGIAAFITAAVNDVDIERALGLDHLRDAVIAVCGCGPASGRRETLALRYNCGIDRLPAAPLSRCTSAAASSNRPRPMAARISSGQPAKSSRKRRSKVASSASLPPSRASAAALSMPCGGGAPSGAGCGAGAPATAGSGASQLASTAYSVSGSIGLVTKSFMPAARLASRKPATACAVMAITGRPACRLRSRMRAVAW